MSIIKLHPADNVAVAVKPITAGECFEDVQARTDIPFGHKIAQRDISAGEKVVKYGYPIGCATQNIATGEHIHSHNLATGLGGQLEYTYAPLLTPPPPRSAGSFAGFVRSDGRVGIRNEIWIIPTVGCVNSVGNMIAKKAEKLVAGSVQGVYSFPHPYGCSQLGKDHENTKKALAGLCKHPNTGGVLVLGLGCENNSVQEVREMLGDVDGKRMKFLVAQEHKDEVSAALELIGELIAAAKNDVRLSVPTSELIVGLKCGGSDGLSGITANPLVGAFTDRLIAEGGSAILTEVPEMFGAETILMNRCKDEVTFRKTVALINGFKAYFTAHGQPVYENPSPGNKDGGITTLEDKALGCTQKAGTATVADVLSYGVPLRERGLNLLEAPGNDLVASTALAVSGAHIVLFTTGRGTPFGSPVPTIKISSNTRLAEKKRGWVDFDAGALAFGASIDGMADAFYSEVLEIANGKPTKAEINGIRDMAIFKGGVTL